MSTPFQRGMVLFSQSRFDLASREFRNAVAQDPESVRAHGYLALCLAECGEKGEALREADETVRLDASLAFSHRVRAAVLYEFDDFAGAEVAAQEAVRLDPNDVDQLGLLATVLCQRGKWIEARDLALRGLQRDPDHPACTTARALAMTGLGQQDNAAQVLTAALANDPGDPVAHGSLGWVLLHQGNSAKALVHFREALRIEPGYEWARLGMLEALKARYFVYRIMLRVSLWLRQQSTTTQLSVVAGTYIGYLYLDGLVRRSPALQPYHGLLAALVYGFIILWLAATPLFNLLLRLNPFGRRVLTSDQRLESSVVGACAALFIAAYLLNAWRETDLAAVSVVFFGHLLFPLLSLFSLEAGRPRRLMVAATVFLVALTVPTFALIWLGQSSPFGNLGFAAQCFRVFGWGCILLMVGSTPFQKTTAIV